jgi:DNA-binding response OmpR family regulator
LIRQTTIPATVGSLRESFAGPRMNKRPVIVPASASDANARKRRSGWNPDPHEARRDELDGHRVPVHIVQSDRRLPAADGGKSANHQAEKVFRMAASQPKTGNIRQALPRVLVLADMPESGEWLVREVLLPKGFPAEVARPDSAPADVLAVDLTQLQGLQVTGLRQRREQGETAPAIVMASRINPELARDLFRLGVRDFLLKPCKPDDIVQSLLNAYRQSAVQAGERQNVEELRANIEQLRRRNEELRSLLDIGRAVTQTRQADLLLRQIVEAAAYLTGAEDAGVYMLEEISGDIILRASKEAQGGRAMTNRIPVSDEFVNQVVKSGQTVVRQRSGQVNLKVKTGYMVQTLANVPIWVEGRIGGVLGVYNRTSQVNFSEHHVQLLRGLAAWAGVALERLMRSTAAGEAAPVSGTAPLPSVVSPAEFRQAMMTFIAEVAKVVGTNPNLPNRANLWKLRAQVEEWLKRLPAEGKLTAPPPTGTEVFQYRKVIGDALLAVRQAAGSRKVPILTQLAGEFPNVFGNPQAAQTGLQTLIGWSIGRSTRTPVDLVLFRLKGGEPSGPFAITHADKLPLGEWVVLSIVDSGPALTQAELTDIRRQTAQVQPTTPLGAAYRQIRSGQGLLWVEGSTEPVTIYVGFRAAV